MLDDVEEDRTASREDDGRDGQEASHSRSAFVRARNRAYQALYRARFKDQIEGLEASIADCSQQISTATARWRVLRERRRLLWDTSCPLQAHAQHAEHIACRDRQQHGHKRAPSAATAVHAAPSPPPPASEPQGLPDASQKVPDLVRAFSADESEGPVDMALLHRPCIRPSVLWKAPSKKSHVQPMSAYACSAPIHFGGLAGCAAQNILTDSAENPSSHKWLASALTSYMNAESAAVQRAPCDICWFVQFPYDVGTGSEAFGKLLSSSASSNSPECCLSGSIAIHATRIECLLLGAEHDMLEASAQAADATTHDSSGAQQPLLSFLQGLVDASPGGTGSNTHARAQTKTDTSGADAKSTDGHQAHAPVDEKLLSWIHLRCGIEERCPAGTAVRRVVRAMLRPEKSTLPRLLWRAACMQSIRWLQETVDCMHAASESSESESDAPAALLKHIHKMERDTMDRGPAKPTGVPGAMNSASLPQAFSTGNEISSQPRMQQQAVEAILGASPGRHFSMSIQRDGDATGGGTRSHSFPSAQLVPQQGDLSGDRHRPSDDGPKKMQPPVVGDSFQLTWEQLPTAALVVCQQMLYEAHQVLKEDTEQEQERCEMHRTASTCESVRARILELVGSGGLMGRITFQTCPFIACSLMNAGNLTRRDHAQDERLQMKVISSLLLTEDQRKHHAEEWHRWCRRHKRHRDVVDDLIQRLDCLLPTHSDLPVHLTQMVLAHVSEPSTACRDDPPDPVDNPQSQHTHSRNSMHQQHMQHVRGASCDGSQHAGGLYTNPMQAGDELPVAGTTERVPKRSQPSSRGVPSAAHRFLKPQHSESPMRFSAVMSTYSIPVSGCVDSFRRCRATPLNASGAPHDGTHRLTTAHALACTSGAAAPPSRGHIKDGHGGAAVRAPWRRAGGGRRSSSASAPATLTCVDYRQTPHSKRGTVAGVKLGTREGKRRIVRSSSGQAAQNTCSSPSNISAAFFSQLLGCTPAIPATKSVEPRHVDPVYTFLGPARTIHVPHARTGIPGAGADDFNLHSFLSGSSVAQQDTAGAAVHPLNPSHSTSGATRTQKHTLAASTAALAGSHVACVPRRASGDCARKPLLAPSTASHLQDSLKVSSCLHEGLQSMTSICSGSNAEQLIAETQRLIAMSYADVNTLSSLSAFTSGSGRATATAVADMQLPVHPSHQPVSSFPPNARAPYSASHRRPPQASSLSTTGVGALLSHRVSYSGGLHPTVNPTGEPNTQQHRTRDSTALPSPTPPLFIASQPYPPLQHPLDRPAETSDRPTMTAMHNATAAGSTMAAPHQQQVLRGMGHRSGGLASAPDSRSLPTVATTSTAITYLDLRSIGVPTGCRSVTRALPVQDRRGCQEPDRASQWLCMPSEQGEENVLTRSRSCTVPSMSPGSSRMNATHAHVHVEQGCELPPHSGQKTLPHALARLCATVNGMHDGHKDSVHSPAAVNTAGAAEEQVPHHWDSSPETSCCSSVTQSPLLGECGQQLDGIEHVLSELSQASRSDALLISQSCMPLWNLTPVQHARALAGAVSIRAPRFDYSRVKEVAAHEEKWKELFGPFCVFE